MQEGAPYGEFLNLCLRVTRETFPPPPTWRWPSIGFRGARAEKFSEPNSQQPEGIGNWRKKGHCWGSLEKCWQTSRTSLERLEGKFEQVH